jgi:hypothetical protein
MAPDQSTTAIPPKGEQEKALKSGSSNLGTQSATSKGKDVPSTNDTANRDELILSGIELAGKKRPSNFHLA